MPDARRTAPEMPPVIVELQATIGPEDVERAKVAAQRDGSALLNAMLNAKERQE